MLVLATGSLAAKIEELITQGQAQGLNIFGYLPLGHSPLASVPTHPWDDSGSLLEIVEHHGIEEIVVAIQERRGGGLPIDELLDCKLSGIQILDLPAFFERQTGMLPLK